MFFETYTGLDDLCWYLLFNKLQMLTLNLIMTQPIISSNV